MVDWHDFVIDVSTHFRYERGMNVVEEFNRLQQTDSIESYVDEFENLKAIMLQNGYCLHDSYLLESFIGGMKPGVKPLVRAFKPQSIAAAIEYARLQEESIKANSQKTWKPNTYPQNSYQNTTLNYKQPPLLPTPAAKPLAMINTTTKPPKIPKYVPADVRAEKLPKDCVTIVMHLMMETTNALSKSPNFLQ